MNSMPYGSPRTSKNGVKATTHGAGPKTAPMPPRGPGPSAKRKGGIPASSAVENTRRK